MASLSFFDWIKGIAWVFVHPVFYFSFILAMIAGVLRVKRERNDFHTKVRSSLHELRSLLPAGVVAGLALSLISIMVGFVLPLPILIAIAIVTVFLGAIGNGRLLSPALTVGLPFIFAIVIQYVQIDLSFWPNIDSLYLIAGTFFVALLVLTEGILIRVNGLKDISPKLRESRRGLTVGAFQTKRLWLLPMFLFLPNGSFVSPFDWWPVIHWGTEQYSVILVPFLLGFQQQIQTALPQKSVYMIARQVIGLGLLLAVLAATQFFFVNEWLTFAIVVIAVLGRLWISYQHRTRENATHYYFTPLNKGLMILDVLPNTPAQKMGLKTGEIITTCNQVEVQNKQELFEALLRNRAYCKLEVFDTNGEIRFVQGALYEGDHHELGILFIEKRKKGKLVDAG